MNATIIVAALGYFVDVFDLLLFSILRVPSLKDLGLTDAEILEKGLQILNLQLLGLILGGVIWGIIGDKLGRVSVLFGSILIYSIANIGCAYVESIEIYSYLRFLAGFGLAGELGAGITLVSELLPKEKRGWGTTLVTGVGVAGAIAAGILGDILPWRDCYLIGGTLGIFLLFARMKVAESGAFKSILTKSEVHRGSLLMLLSSTKRVKKYLQCILMGLPLMFVIYVFVTLSPELGKSLGISEPVSAALAVMYCYIGITTGDVLFGALSQILKSRKLPCLISQGFVALGLIFVWFVPPSSPTQFYIYAAILGMACANWAVLLTTTSEQFGTNLRATVTTSVPNMIRGSAIGLTLCFTEIKTIVPSFEAALLVGAISLLIGALAVWKLEETYARDINFLEK